MNAQRLSPFRSALFVAIEVGTEPPAALGNALQLAEAEEINLTLFDVIPPRPQASRDVTIGDVDVHDAAAEAIEAELERWPDPFDFDVETDAAVAIGRRPAEVVERVVRDRHGLVIVAPDGSPDSLAVARRLMKVCPCPLLVLRSTVVAGNVLVALDPSDRLDLNILLLQIAADQAQRSGGKLHIVNTYVQPAGALLTSGGDARFGGREFDRYLTDLHNAHRDDLSELVERVGVSVPHELHLAKGTAAAAITELVDWLDITAVIVGAAGRNDIEPFLIGNTAERLIGSTKCSVFIAKPPGFDPVNPADLVPEAEVMASA